MGPSDPLELEELFTALGDNLGVGGGCISLLVVGGAALVLRGWVARTTQDVDVLAMESGGRFAPPSLPPRLERAVERVARDFNVPSDWLNIAVGSQWRAGLPPSVEEEVEWREYGALRIGLAGRQTLITLKLFAATDHGPRSVHMQDLLTLVPTDQELEGARSWVLGQDQAPEFPSLLDEVIRHVQSRR